MIVPVARNSKCDVVTVIFAQEGSHFGPSVSSFTAVESADRATSFAISAAHASDWDLHGHYNQDYREDSSLTKPKRQVRRHCAVCIVVSKDLSGDEESIYIKHPPVKPSPLGLVLWLLLLSFV